ncbi:hypothetical protein A0H76_1177 [Hepatospora eriocheir]|uniref:Uncharacterized protein n=1 Tax=Hepatospora eriocheir TaxID=1081669 RepID=A0A1X0QKZ3_9MICR|nr:hypothetical protein A0H76_1177 [Hepatospora eriocheir]
MSSLSKKDKKIQEFKNKVNILIDMPNRNKNDQKQFEKSFRKFMSELDKYSDVIEECGFDSIKTLFSDEKVVNTNKFKSCIDEFYNNYEIDSKLDTVITDTSKSNVKQLSIDEILDIEDDDKKIEELIAFGNKNIQDTSYLLPLYSLYKKNNDVLKMIDVMRMFLNKESSNRIKDKYLYDIYRLIDSELEYKEYEGLVYELFKNSDEDFIKNRYLQLKFFGMYNQDDFIDESDINELFRLVYLIKNDRIDEAEDYFDVEIYKEDLSKDYVIDILSEFGDVLFKNCRYECSFNVYWLMSEFKDVKLKFYCSIVALSLNCDKPSMFYNKEPFQLFLDDFKSFERNIFVLESADPLIEIFRAFYLLKLGDTQECNKILENVYNKL